MRHYAIFFMLLFVPVLMIGQANTWLPVANFAGVSRMYPVSFSVNNQGYVGLGSDSSFSTGFWKFDPATNSWSQSASFPGNGRLGATSFVIGNAAYVGGGQGDTSALVDFWKFTPLTNQWIPISNFPGVPRCWATSFAAYNRGYVGSGRSYSTPAVLFADFWQYLPVNDTWTQISSIPDERSGASSFSINNRGYVIGGRNNVIGDLSDMWKYDPTLDLWSSCASIPHPGREVAFAFSAGGQGYYGCGASPIVFISDFLKYNPANNTWTALYPPTVDYRLNAPSFVCNDTAYLGMGWWSYTDFWKFYPDNTVSISEPNSTTVSISAFPNPASQVVNISLDGVNADERLLIKTFDANGSLVREYSTRLVGQQITYSRNGLSSGSYFLEFYSDETYLTSIKILFQ